MRCVPAIWILLLLALSGCPKREQPPKSAYDSKLLEAARAVARDRQIEEEQAASQDVQVQESPTECTRQTGGCKPGYICWDSYFCKQGFDDQCSAAGDKRCHKECGDNRDCPKDMPYCLEKPIFSGSERGRAEKFCVEKK